MSDDGLTFYVDEKDNAAASILLGQNGVPTEGFSIDNVFDGGFSSTEADKTKKYKLYLENYFADQLETLSNVESASVTLDIPNDDGTILAREQDSYAAVILTLNSDKFLKNPLRFLFLVIDHQCLCFHQRIHHLIRKHGMQLV